LIVGAPYVPLLLLAFPASEIFDFILKMFV
jgi:hypothetical protein